MYQVAIVKADYEGWWLFDEWKDNIYKSYDFDTCEAMETFYHELVYTMTADYHSYKKGKYDMIAFFNVCELEYCEDCEEDVQIYYTPIMIADGEAVK